MRLFPLKFPRMTDWLVVTLVLFAIIAVLKPELLAVSLYKLSLITMAAVVGYWIDRSLFPYARSDSYLNVSDWRKYGKRENSADYSIVSGYELVFGLAMLRRSLLISTAMLSVSLGI